MSKNSIYCVHCGKKNKISKEKKCMLCKKNLYEKDHEIRDYFYEKLKDEITGNIEGNVINFITAFIKKYFYGIVVSASVVFTATSLTINALNKPNTQLINYKPNLEEVSLEQRIIGCFHEEDSSIYYIFKPNHLLDVKDDLTTKEDIEVYDYGYKIKKEHFEYQDEEGNTKIVENMLEISFQDGNAGSMGPFELINNDQFIYSDRKYNRVSCDEITYK